MIPVQDHYVLLLPDSPDEHLLTPEELTQFLSRLLQEYPQVQEHPEAPIAQQVQRLLDTTCQLSIRPGYQVQWFAVRLTKPTTEG